MIETRTLDPAIVFHPTETCSTCAGHRAAVRKATDGENEAHIAARQQALDSHVQHQHPQLKKGAATRARG